MRSVLATARAGLSSSEQFVLLVVTLSPVAWIPRFVEPSLPRMVLALVLLPLGVGHLVARAKTGDTASRLALGLLVIGMAASLTSPAPIHGLIGSSQSWIGTLGYATGFAWWACGREMSTHARRLLVPALTIGAVWNVVLALVQVIAQQGSPDDYTYPDRALATMQNPVYFGAFMSGITACWLARRTFGRTSTAVVFVLSFGAGLAGGRAVVGAVLLVAVWATFRRSSRPAAFANLMVTTGGFVSATLLVTAMSTTRSISDRAAKASGFRDRLSIWRIGFESFAERPLLGWGPANIELAVERQFDLTYTREHLMGDSLLRWIDLHNVVLNVLVGFGAVGLVVAIGFVAYSCRGVQQPEFFAGAFAIAANWMLEPVTVHTLPIAMILFGAAGPRILRTSVAQDPKQVDQPVSLGVTTPPRDRYLLGTGCAVGLFVLCTTFLVDYGLRTANLDLSSAATRYGYRDQFIDDQMAQAYTNLAQVRPDDAPALLAEAEAFAQHFAKNYPTVYSYERLGGIQFVSGDVAGAFAREREALEFQPWHPTVNLRLLFEADQSGDRVVFGEQMQKLCAIGATRCDPGAGIDDE